jgi:hypothetical protein
MPGLLSLGDGHPCSLTPATAPHAVSGLFDDAVSISILYSVELLRN